MEKEKNYFLPASILISAIIVAGAWIYTSGLNAVGGFPTNNDYVGDFSEAADLGLDSVTIPVRWGDLGIKMVSAGVIDQVQLESIYSERGGLDLESKKLLVSSSNGNLIITSENSGFLLNLLWALGLGNKNNILENGPMSDPRYESPSQLASVGGWTIAKGDAINHYSKHTFLTLTPEQQNLVERVAKNIYRPCCSNSTYFPDCNHGMAMLGLLELMASQGLSEDEMYKIALQVNAFWFPSQYSTIEKYFSMKGLSLNEVNPKEILGANFSSASGYQKILKQVTSPEPKKSSGGGCSV